MNKQYKYDNLLAQGAHVQVNIILMQRLGLNEAIMAAELLSIQKYFAKKRQLSTDGFFYAQYEYMKEDISLTKNQMAAAIKHLETNKVLTTNISYVDGKKTKWYKVNTHVYDDYLRSGDGSICMNTETNDSYIVYNKDLANAVGPAAAIIFSDLYTSYKNIEADGNLIEGEWFKSMQTKLAKKCGVTPKTICKNYMPILKNAGLISVKQMGYPKCSYVKLNFDVLDVICHFTDIEIKSDITSNTFELISKENISEVERITKSVLDEVKKVSGNTWTFNYEKMARIEEMLNAGYTEEQLLAIINHMYNYYKNNDKLTKSFNFNNLVGQKSKVAQWLDKIENDKEKDEKQLVAEKITATISSKLLEHSKGEIDYKVDANKIDLIRRRLNEGLTEEELVNHALNRYDFCIKAGYKMTPFSKLFGPKCFDEIHSARVSKELNKKKNFKFNTKDGVKSRTLTREDIENAKAMADAIEAAGGQGYF